MKDDLSLIVTIVGVIIGAIVAFVIYWLQRQRKYLVYEVLANIALVSQIEELKEDLKIEYKGEVVDSVYLIAIRISNAGNTPIGSDDYEEDVRISFDDNVKILQVYIDETEPDNLKPKIYHTPNEVFLKPLLLNSTDSIRINILSNYSSIPVVEARIKGVKKIQLRKSMKNGSIWWVIISSAVIGYSLSMLLLKEYQTSNTVYFIGLLAAISVSVLATRLIRAIQRLYANR